MQLINYCSFSVSYAGFSENVYQLLKSISKKDKVLTINIFGCITTEKYWFNYEIIKQTTQQIFGRLPLLSYIAQSSENENTLIAEVGYLADKISLSAISYHSIPAGRYLIINTDKFCALLVEGLISPNFQDSIAKQSLDVFNKIQLILDTVSMPIENIVRQWNYIGHITEVEENSQNYQEFNNARSMFYKSANWTNGFPAATGISMDIHAVSVSFIALKFHSNSVVFPLNNSLQLAAHRYSQTVLGKSVKKETPKFERAKLIVSANSSYCFISGTAAILGEKSINKLTASEQAWHTIQIIRHLISQENLSANGIDKVYDLKIVHLRVYVKVSSDIEAVRNILETELPAVNVIYLCAGVCREELLVEIEGIAITKN